MNRREFLKALTGIGVTALVPVEVIAALAEDQVDEIWEIVKQSPLQIDVLDGGTLVIANYPDPQHRRDCYDVSELSVIFPKVLALELGACYPLERFVAEHCEELKDDALYKLEESLNELDLTEEDRQSRLAAEADRWPDTEDPDALADWVADLDEAAFSALANAVCRWMDGEPVWLREQEYFSDYVDGQVAALTFFKDLPRNLLKQLGVIIVEGEHPGSSYYAADLQGTPETANRAAAEADLPVCFRIAAGATPK